MKTLFRNARIYENGVMKKADMFFEIYSVYKKSGSDHPEWGEPETPHYVIKLGERVELVD